MGNCKSTESKKSSRGVEKLPPLALSLAPSKAEGEDNLTIDHNDADSVTDTPTEIFSELEYNRKTQLIKCAVSLNWRDFDSKLRQRSMFGLSLLELNSRLADMNMFVPYGLCFDSTTQYSENSRNVGCGMGGRSHGLFSDYIEGFDLLMKNNKGHVVKNATVWKPGSPAAPPRGSKKMLPNNDSLFWLILESSPDLIGVITHVYIRPLHDKDYPNSRGMKIISPYSSERLENALKIMTELSDNVDFSRDIDYSLQIFTDIDNFWNKKGEEKDSNKEANPMIVIQCQFANTGGEEQVFDNQYSTIFRSLRKAMGKDFIDATLDETNGYSYLSFEAQRLLDVKSEMQNSLDFANHTPMSELMKYWIYDDVRQYRMTYKNQTFVSQDSDLEAKGWSEWSAKTLDKFITATGESHLVKDISSAVITFQHLGGNTSMYWKNSMIESKTCTRRFNTRIIQSIDFFPSDPNKSFVPHPMYEQEIAAYDFFNVSPSFYPSPGTTLHPSTIEEFRMCVEYAKRYDLKLEVRVSDKVYTSNLGTSKPKNSLKLDITDSFKEMNYLDSLNLYKCASSITMIDFFNKMRGHNACIPSGIPQGDYLIMNTNMGGYGQICRSFGLFNEYVEGFEYFTVDSKFDQVISVRAWKPGSKQTLDCNLTQEENDKIYKSILEGNTDNSFVVSHVYLRAIPDKEHADSRGMKLIAPYSRNKVQNCLQIMAEMTENDELPSDFDFRVQVFTNVRNFNYKKRVPGSDDENDVVVHGSEGTKMGLIVLFLHWGNAEGSAKKFGKHEGAIFRSVRRSMGSDFIDGVIDDKSGFSHMVHDAKRLFGIKAKGLMEIPLDFTKPTPLSEMTRYWAYDEMREYEMPCKSRTYTAGQSGLSSGDDWVEWTTERLDMVVSDKVKNFNTVMNVQVLGGSFSALNKSTKSETKIMQSFDIFADHGDWAHAVGWQKENDAAIHKYGLEQK